MKRTFTIEFSDDLGPLWMNRDNLVACLTTTTHCGPEVRLTVADITDDEHDPLNCEVFFGEVKVTQ
jgi:hypothetical protein